MRVVSMDAMGVFNSFNQSLHNKPISYIELTLIIGLL